VSYSAVTVSPATESHGTANDGFVGWLRLSGNHPDPGQYDVTTRRATQQQIAKNAILAADSYINFASYDTNGDGTVSSTELAILIIVAGYEGAIGYTQPSVYPEASNMSTVGYPSVDGKTIEKYALVGEIHTDHLATFGLMTHELGHHMFLLPDLYGSGTSRGIGRFDLMANGNWGAASGAQQGSSPTHLSAWCKEYLSWGTVTTISSNQTVSFPKVDGNSASIFRINTSDPNQYFLIENRQFSGYDIGFQVDTTASGHGGLVIYHVDTTKTSLYPNTANVNEDVNDKGVDVEEANQGSYGSSMLDTGFAEAHTNMFFFSGNNTSFSNTTTPNSKLKNGNATNISITDISAYGDTMTATVIVPPIVSSTSPASGATDVAISTPITATFSVEMDSSTVNTSTFTLSGGVTGTVSYDSSTKTATFTPSSNLSYSTTYTATITTGIKDSTGNTMAANYTWSFTTTSLFNINTVDNSGEVGGYTSLSLDSSGKVYISYYGDGNLKYATNVSGSWATTTVDSSGNVGEYNSIAIDSSGKAYISYYDRTNNNLKYATNATGSWVTTTVDSSGNVAGYISIALDSSGKAHISYFDGTNGVLKYATNVTGSWVTTTADTNGGTGGYTSIALDSSGKAHISYYVWGNGDLKYATNTPGLWVTTTVDSNSDAGQYTSIALDPSGKAYISYYDATDGDLKYATNATGSWVTTTVDSSNDVGQYASLALDSSRKAHISYYDATNGNLRYVTNATGSWVSSTMDDSGNVGLYTSLKLDSSGKAHISYFDKTNGFLKYALNNTAPPTVSSTSPASGATDVAITTFITATFSKAMDSSTISASTFSLSGGITGTVSYDNSTKTATFTPSSNLSYSTPYTATITTGVKDSAGNTMDANYAWSFVTEPAPVIASPTPAATPSPTVTPSPAICTAESIMVSPARLNLKRNQSSDVTITVTGEGDCPAEGETVDARISMGNKLVSISSSSQKTEENGQAVFTIVSRKKAGVAKITFSTGGLKKSLTVKVRK
jgi:M6 family metalloprotease-like protein